ncbi:alpha-amylase family glycosyl hydrolase [Ovoidimarina sediminis]|uniref:alpha-amylase family glycosyl hydrolase n=1 Tax=Ovoidimarina sediminis TaxID=3079856 RepID=UPI00290DEF9F|nr:alpha-amylase family glycosyl hydrolase [Rhodophyticola sp. MJ-SS7]MDU8945126.1 alpha-amylase family glycosyl hydrolase [Rhodophyticola sp. MJ-SS7]
MLEARSVLAPDPDWWRGAVIYQIYPRSFQDSNGDGIGDLAGIIHRLPHVADLGVDAIWISPFFPSPMLDFGYDVSAYRDVDPMFGTLGDFDALINRAHELGLRVLIDLVLSHTSESHRWFTESRSSRDNPRADWYVWADAKPDGTPPNNWLSIFGGSAWEWDGERMQYYLHNFLAEQPDLNLHNPEVQDELLEIARFWLTRGVDGFRLDTVNFYFHDRALRDNPPLRPEDRNDRTAPSVNPYNFQDHLYDKTQPENIAFLKRLRALCDEFPDRTTVGEVGESQRGMEVQAEYTKGNDRLHMCYDFALLSNAEPTGTYVAEVLERANDIVSEGWACWAYSNHDVVRHTTRWGLSEPALRVYAALLMSIRGSICLYQGEELGLTEAYVAFEELQDPYGKRFWPKFKGRDGCRTPMPWIRDNQYGGFTDGKPWLPVAMEHLQRAVGVQWDDPGSTLAFYQKMIAFRAAHPALAKGTLDIVEAADDRLSFIRAHDGTRLFCAFNLSGETISFTRPEGTWRQDKGAPFTAGLHNDIGAELPAWQAFFAIEEQGDT